MKEIEKYVGYYLGVYVVLLAICGFFQYFYYCQGQSLMCAVTKTGIMDIVTVTAYVLTPIIAIIGFQSWKNEKQYDLEKQYSIEILESINEIKTFLDIKYYDLSISNLENVQKQLNESKIFNLLEKQYFISAKFKTLQKISNTNKLSDNFLKNFENDSLLFSTAIEMKNKHTALEKVGVLIKCSNGNLVKQLIAPLSEFKLTFDNSYSEITKELIKFIKP